MDSSVRIEISYGLDGRGSIPDRGDFSGSVAHTASYPMGIGGSFPEVKWLGREADYSLLSLPRSRRVDPNPRYPTRLHGVVLN
jgi:hypothetical protein